MSPTKIPAMSTDDCDILYEKITTSNQCGTQSIRGNCGQSNTIRCFDRVKENHNCTCKLIGSEYPNYAADEILLFHKLQSGVIPSPADTKAALDESIDLEIEISDVKVNYPDPEKNSDSMDCEVLWDKYADSSKPNGDQSAKKLDVTKNSEVLQQETAAKESLELDSISLSTSIYDVSSYLEQTKAEEPEDAGGKDEKKTTSAPSCEICKISLSTIYELKAHLLDHANGTKTKADIYKKSIIALQQLDYRVRTDKLRRRHNCVICHKVFLTRTDLRWHINISHSDGRPYQCQLCHKNYKRKCHLMRHEFTHWK